MRDIYDPQFASSQSPRSHLMEDAINVKEAGNAQKTFVVSLHGMFVITACIQADQTFLI